MSTMRLRVRHLGHAVWTALRAARGGLLLFVLVAALAGAATLIAAMIQTGRRNAVIAQLAEGRDVAVDPATAPDALLLARHHFLIVHDRLDDAQIFAEIAMPRTAPQVRAQLLYNLGNARVRQAFAYIENADLDRAASAIGLAKANFRQALGLEPQNWNLKHNLDVAQRLVRDLPRDAASDDDEPPPSDKAKPLWSDLPGLPRGLP
uniref:MxaK protein n=1 Tax=Rhodopseudomonas palustris (strain BisA53) TaxID=316055 RepID=Q07LW7_RHOP5